MGPHSAESESPRRAAIDIHRRVLAGADTRYDPDLAEQLPQLLWLQQMGLVLFWVHDRSENSVNSRRLVERVAPIVACAISLTRFRLLRPLVRGTHELLGDFMPTAAGMAADGPRRRAGEGTARTTGETTTEEKGETATEEAEKATGEGTTRRARGKAAGGRTGRKAAEGPDPGGRADQG